MDDFLSESIKTKMPSVEDLIYHKKSDVVFEVNKWQKEILGKYHIRMC